MIKNRNLKNIANIISGYSFRSASSIFPPGDTFILQSRDLRNDMTLDLHNELTFNVGDIKTKAFTEINDILVGSKGNPTIGYVERDEKILVSSSMYIIRVTDKTVLPKYLAIYLNSLNGQRELNKITLGGYIKGISKTNLETLVVPIPSKEIQEKIISLHDNIVKQKRLLGRKSEINREILDYTLDHLSFY